jgi:hypothetical protein
MFCVHQPYQRARGIVCRVGMGCMECDQADGSPAVPSIMPMTMLAMTAARNSGKRTFAKVDHCVVSALQLF